MSATQDQRSALAEYLEGVLGGRGSLSELLETPGPHREALEHCFHGLHHYLNDYDIRSKDPAYRRMQDEEMKLLIHLLRQGASDEEVSRVSFLGRARANT
jgi:hypothetical protein